MNERKQKKIIDRHFFSAIDHSGNISVILLAVTRPVMFLPFVVLLFICGQPFLWEQNAVI
jgi:hypothetical protein